MIPLPPHLIRRRCLKNNAVFFVHGLARGWYFEWDFMGVFGRF